MTATEEFELTEAHIEAIREEHTAAFAGRIVTDYTAGQTVWMVDHYNTCQVTRAWGGKPGTWLVETFDADGSRHEYECDSEDLRPAARPVNFRLPGVK
jgi:hypothetical protein